MDQPEITATWAAPGAKLPSKVTPRLIPDAGLIQAQSVQVDSPQTSSPGPNVLTLYIANAADEFAPWGHDPQGRDRQLREFWPQESTLAGALYGVAASHAAFNFRVEGPETIANKVMWLIHSANFGKGWTDFVIKLTLDLLTQDNGAFIEIIREEDRSDAPIIGIAHLDAGACIRTGNLWAPVRYRDYEGREHLLRWYQVITLEEMPSPIQTMFGMQYSALTRVLRAAQVLRDIAIYKGEKVSGRWQRAIHIVGGPGRQEIKDAMALSEEDANNMGLRRYMVPTILASLDPSKSVSHVEIPLASLPDGFDMDVEMKWYIAQLALGFGLDYQDLAPLSSGGLGSSQQSEILHMKSRGKGPALFMKMLEHLFNYHGIMPRSCKFEFDQMDIRQEIATADLKLKRSQRLQTMIESRVITPEIARQIAEDEGDIPKWILEKIDESDITPGVVLADTEIDSPPIGEGEFEHPDKTLPENAQIQETPTGGARPGMPPGKTVPKTERASQFPKKSLLERLFRSDDGN